MLTVVRPAGRWPVAVLSEPVKPNSVFVGARVGQVEAFRKAYSASAAIHFPTFVSTPSGISTFLAHAAIVRARRGRVHPSDWAAVTAHSSTQAHHRRHPPPDGDVIGCGATDQPRVHTSQPTPQLRPAGETAAELLPAPARNTGVRIAVEVARQTAQLRRTTKCCSPSILTAGASGAAWQASQRAQLEQLQFAPTLMREARLLATRSSN